MSNIPNLSGWKQQEVDERDHKLMITAPVVLPSKVDNRKSCPPNRDQGGEGACTGFAGALTAESCIFKACGKFVDLAPQFLYYMTRVKIEHGSAKNDSGCTVRDVMKSLATYGDCLEKSFPYKAGQITKVPTAANIKEALNYKITEYVLVDSPNLAPKDVLTAVKTQLYLGFILDFGFYVWSSYQQSASNGGGFPFPTKKESLDGGHSVRVVGYDDTKVIVNTLDGSKTTGALLIANSWGTSWGFEGGFGWLPYDYITKPINGQRQATDFWKIISENCVKI